MIHPECMQAHEQDVEIEISVIPRTQSSSPPLLAAAALLSGAFLILFCLPFLASDALRRERIVSPYVLGTVGRFSHRARLKVPPRLFPCHRLAHKWPVFLQPRWRLGPRDEPLLTHLTKYHSPSPIIIISDSQSSFLSFLEVGINFCTVCIFHFLAFHPTLTSETPLRILLEYSYRCVPTRFPPATISMYDAKRAIFKLQ